MPRPKPNPELVDLAMQMVADGASFRDIGEGLGKSEAVIRKWAKERGVIAPASTAALELPAHMRPAAPAVPPGPPIDTTDLHALVQSLIKDQHAMVLEARAANPRAAAQAAGGLEKLARLLKQIESARDEDATTVHIPRVELERAKESIRARYLALRSRPLLCAHCARQLSIAWGTGVTGGTTVTPKS